MDRPVQSEWRRPPSPRWGGRRRLLSAALSTALLCSLASGCRRTPPIAPPQIATIAVEGMTCQSCVSAISAKVGQMAGVDAIDVQLEHKRAEIRYRPATVDAAQLVAAINSLGYQATLLRSEPIKP